MKLEKKINNTECLQMENRCEKDSIRQRNKLKSKYHVLHAVLLSIARKTSWSKLESSSAEAEAAAAAL